MRLAEEKTESETAAIAKELEEAVDRALHGIRDRDAMRKSCERMDRVSEEIRKKHGLLDIGTPAIREIRDS